MDFRNVSQSRLPILSAIFVLIVLGATGLWAQTTDVNYKGFTAYEEARASTGDSGQFVVLDTNIGYDFNKHVGMDVGIPVYFVRPTLPGQTHQWDNELGDPYLDLRLTADNPVVNYSTAITVSIPARETGAFSTGRAGINWFNHFDRPIYRFTPFVNAGIGNGILDTRLLSQPFRLTQLFKTLGFIADLEGGADFTVMRGVKVGGSYYALEPSGPQKIYGKRRPNNVQGVPLTPDASLVTHDRGYSAWLRIQPSRFFYLEPGYSHSIKLDQDAATVTVGLDLTSLLRRPTARRH